MSISKMITTLRLINVRGNISKMFGNLCGALSSRFCLDQLIASIDRLEKVDLVAFKSPSCVLTDVHCLNMGKTGKGRAYYDNIIIYRKKNKKIILFIYLVIYIMFAMEKTIQ